MNCRRLLTCLAWCAISLPPALPAQQLDWFRRTDRRTNRNDRETSARLAVDDIPGQNGADLRQAPEIVKIEPSPFCLRGNESTVLGPFDYENGSTVKIGAVTFNLVEAGQKTFSLRNASSTETLGPFACTNEAPVTLNGTNLIFAREPSILCGTVIHPRVALSSITIVLVPVTPVNRAQLLQLGSAFVDLTQRYGGEIAPVTLRGVPTIRGSLGSDRTPTVAAGDKDVARARKKADLAAKGAFVTFMNRAAVRTCKTGNDQRFAFQNVPPSLYVLCAMADVRPGPKNPGGREPNLATWWVNLRVKDGELTDLAFTEGNARDWQSLFKAAR